MKLYEPKHLLKKPANKKQFLARLLVLCLILGLLPLSALAATEEKFEVGSEYDYGTYNVKVDAKVVNIDAHYTIQADVAADEIAVTGGLGIVGGKVKAATANKIAVTLNNGYLILDDVTVLSKISISAGTSPSAFYARAAEPGADTVTIKGITEFDEDTTFEGVDVDITGTAIFDGDVTFADVTLTISGSASVEGTMTLSGNTEIRIEGPDAVLAAAKVDISKLENEDLIVLDGNGGYWDGDKDQAVMDKTADTLPSAGSVNAPVRDGYKLTGWTANGHVYNGGTKYTGTAKTLYAQWEKKGGGGTGGSGGSGGSGVRLPGAAGGGSTGGTTVVAPSAPSTVGGFSDVLASNTFATYIVWAKENGIMSGYPDGTFRPNANTTRQALWMVLGRLAGANPANMAEARAWAVENGISDGTNPEGYMSRQQMITMLYRVETASGTPTGSADLSAFPDSGLVASYAQEALAWGVANGIITGTTDGRLNPEGAATRAHFAAFLYRYANLA